MKLMAKRNGCSGGCRHWCATLCLAGMLVANVGCQSVNDGARQVSLGAKDLGRRMAAPFRRSSSTPDFGERSSGLNGTGDPFLPPPKAPSDDEVSMDDVRGTDRVTLGKPMTLRPLEEEYQLSAKP